MVRVVKEPGKIKKETALRLRSMTCSVKTLRQQIEWGRGSTEGIKGKTSEVSSQVLKGL